MPILDDFSLFLNIAGTVLQLNSLRNIYFLTTFWLKNKVFNIDIDFEKVWFLPGYVSVLEKNLDIDL